MSGWGRRGVMTAINEGEGCRCGTRRVGGDVFAANPDAAEFGAGLGVGDALSHNINSRSIPLANSMGQEH
jgi:hypothetical protein